MKRFYLLLLIVGVALRLFFAFQYQSRVWIDEVWVVLNPAYRLLTGTGWLNPGDWQIEIRSWLPPSLLFVVMKLLTLLGITKGTTVLFLVRIFGSLFTIAGLLAYVEVLRKAFRLKSPPLFAVAVLFFTPEFIRFSTSADLSVMGLPFLLLGMWLFDAERVDPNPSVIKQGGGALLLSLSVAIRLQFITVPGILFLFLMSRRQWKQASVLVFAASLVIALEAALNTALYGHLTFPFWNYFKANSFGGLAASYGTSPFLFSFEILWHFMTEPAFLIAVVLSPFAIRRSPTLSMAAILLFLSHAIIAHKEFRFFYGPAILLAGVGAIAFQRWLEDQPSKKALPLALGFLILFFGVGIWRASTKVAWAEYEVPSRLETLAGIQPDIKGLITFGWGGIRSGGAYTFHRTLPYEFAENLMQLKTRRLDASLFNYVITGASERPPCSSRLEERHGGVLYRCTNEEIKNLLSPNTGL